jgi:hypothetical protein
MILRPRSTKRPERNKFVINSPQPVVLDSVKRLAKPSTSTRNTSPRSPSITKKYHTWVEMMHWSRTGLIAFTGGVFSNPETSRFMPTEPSTSRLRREKERATDYHYKSTSQIVFMCYFDYFSKVKI